MQENLSGQGSAAGPTEGAYSAPVFLAGGEGAGCPIPKKSTPFSVLQASALAQNRRLGPSQHDGLDPPLLSAAVKQDLHTVATVDR